MNLLDTPGYPDFIGRALAVLAAVETAAVVVNAECGAEMVTQRIMQSAAERKLCRLIIVNKIDAGGTNLERVLADIRERFGRECLPLNLPARRGERSPTASSRRPRKRRISPRSRPRTARSPTGWSSSTMR